MNILVTGAAGLYGVHLVDDLVRRPEVKKVVGIDDMSRQYLHEDPFSNIDSPELKEKFVFRQEKFQNVTVEEIDENEIDCIIHLAAYVSIPESMVPGNELKYFENNEQGTFNLILTLLQTKQKPLLVYASSPEVYGEAVYTPMDINHPLHPKSVYAVTKLAAEKHCQAIHKWHGYPVVIIRNFNTFGENQHVFEDAGVISLFIAKALKGEPITVHDDGKQTRDFQYVKDAVRAYSLVALKGKELSGSIFNIGTGRQVSMNELAKKVVEMSNSDSEITFVKGRSADLRSLEADYKDINASVGWEPEFTFEEGLQRTIDWYRNNLK